MGRFMEGGAEVDGELWGWRRLGVMGSNGQGFKGWWSSGSRVLRGSG
jgi:hypothetical protein